MTDEERDPAAEPNVASSADAPAEAASVQPPEPIGPAPASAETELRTFLIADIRGYTSYTEEHGDEAATALASRFAALIREVVEGRQGFLLELRGDEALAVFTSARQALKAANEIQRRQEIDALPRGIGIGLDAGEAIPFEGGFRGSALNLAARLCGQAGPGQIVASEAVIHLAARVDGLAYVEARTLRLKGLDEPVRAVTVVPEGRAPKRRRTSDGRPRFERRGLLAAGGIALAAVLVAVLAWAGPLGGLGGGGSASASPSSGAAAASPTPTPSLAPGAVAIGTDDLPLTAFLDPATADVADVLTEPRGAADAIFADGSFWVLDRQPRVIYPIDPQSGVSDRPIPIGFEVAAFTVGDGRLFVAEPVGTIHVFDIASRREVDAFPFGGFYGGGIYVQDPQEIFDLAYGDGSLWIAGGWDGDVTRMDPVTGGVQVKVSTVSSGISGSADGVAFGDDAVWVLNSWPGQVTRIDPTTNEITRRTPLQPGTGSIEAGTGAAYVANSASGTVTRVDELGQTTSYSVGGGIAAIAYDDAAGTVWTASLDGSVATIDVLTGAVRAAYLGHAATAIAADDSRVIAGLARTPADVVASLPGSILRIGTNDGLSEIDPAASALDPTLRQYADATCAPLLRRRADEGPDGELLEPFVAAAMPDLSEDGRTYTFTVRDGFAFSPPSGEPLTAETFKYAIERSVTINDQESFFPIYDVVGYFEYRDGQADDIAGITVDGDRLSIRLGAPSQTFLERISLPWFCPVPLGTPKVRAGPDDPPIPRAGPYFVSEHVPGESLILLANPDYPDPAPDGYDAIAYFVDYSLGRSIGKWERDELDIVAGDGPELQVGSRTDEHWGPASDAAAAGDQRLIDRSALGVVSLVVNQGSEVLRDPDVRRAVGLALDRSVLSRYWGAVTDEVMPLTMPGLVDRDRFPLDDSALEEARALLAGRPVQLQVVWPRATWCTECPAIGDSLAKQLEAVGISATFTLADDPVEFANGADSGYDLALSWVGADSPDPAMWMSQFLLEAQPSGGSNNAGFPSGWLPPELVAERERLDDLAGKERFEAAHALADRVATEMASIPFADSTYPQLVSDRVGCARFRAGTPWLDLVAACPG
jgi:class 3 adenylate cyclase/ABC-type transport system substrate-binding protein